MHTLAYECSTHMQIHRCGAVVNDCGAICDNNTLASCAVHTMEEISVERTCIVHVIQTNLYLYDFVKGHLLPPPDIVL